MTARKPFTRSGEGWNLFRRNDRWPAAKGGGRLIENIGEHVPTFRRNGFASLPTRDGKQSPEQAVSNEGTKLPVGRGHHTRPAPGGHAMGDRPLRSDTVTGLERGLGWRACQDDKAFFPHRNKGYMGVERLSREVAEALDHGERHHRRGLSCRLQVIRDFGNALSPRGQD